MSLRPARLLALVLAIAGVGRAAFGGEVRDFYNVIAPDGADPWVWRQGDGSYYLTMTTGRDIVIHHATTLSGLAAGTRKVVWTPPRSGPASRDIWAPELHRIGGRWYLYFAADDGDNAHHRMFVLENDSDDPLLGAFRFIGKLAPPGDDHWAIDGTPFRAGGRLYFLWSGWEGDTDIRQDLYIAPMANPWTIDGPRVAIARPTLDWETHGAPPSVIEGPAVLTRGRSIFVVYAASGSWTDRYCIGLLRADLDSDLLAPGSWSKAEAPAFAGAGGVVSPGHCSFTKSPDGAEDWMIYHAAKARGSGWSRNIRAQPIGWGPDDVPRLGTPAPPDRPIPLPSGEPPRRRFEAEDAALEGPARAGPLEGASGGSGVRLDAPGAAIRFDVGADEARPHLLAIRFAGDPASRREADPGLRVNGVRSGPVRFPNAGRSLWSVAVVRVDLRRGPNRIELGPGAATERVDCLDVAPLPR